MTEIDERRDPDGRFRIAELFSAGEVWRAAVKSLMADADVVVMDVRSFGPEHQGCVFELQTLLDSVPLERLMLLVDSGTKLEFLKQVMDARWTELRIDSPNAQTPMPAMRLYEAIGSESRAAGLLIRTAVAIAREAPSQEDPVGGKRAHVFSAGTEPRVIAPSS